MTNLGAAEPHDILETIHSQMERFVLARTLKGTQQNMGERLAQLRREKGLTQEELAAELQVTQPVVSDYERGRLRLHGELIVQLTAILGVSADEILGLGAQPSRNRTVNNRRLLRQVQAHEKLPKRDQQAVMGTIEAFLAKAG